MKLNPQQAPLYGECVLTVQLDDEDVCPTDKEEEEEKAEFYLLFSGSTQRHVSSTLRVSQVTLQAVCPAHNVCEQVLVTLCVARHGGPVDKESQETFCFVQDLALDMAHFLLDSTDPQEALLLEEQQIPLKECEKLDQSLALALKHLSLPPNRTAPVEAQTGTSLTETQTHKDRETRGDTGNDVSALLDSSTAEAQVKQLCSLLHLAARHGLLAVASYVLQQPGGREALRKTDTRGETAAREAERRGHEQLLELFKRYETSQHAEVESQQQVYPESRVFRHHANLGTYTLTLPALHRKEKRAEPGSREHLWEEVEQLRRLIHGHRDTKGSSGVCGPSAATHTSLHACTNSQQGSRQDAGLAVTIETCSTTTEEQGSPLSLEERTQREEPAGVSQISCSSGSLRQAQEVRAEVKGSPAAGSPAGRNRKNKKKAARSKKTSSEERKRTEQRKTETAERNTDGTTLSTGPVGESVIGVGADTKTVDAEETASLIKPGGKCDDSKAETIIEKQEAEKWEVDLLMCERAAETESVTEIEQRLTEGQTETPRGLSSDLGSAAQITVTMGQEQSQDPQENQLDPEGPSPSDTTKPSPHSVMKTNPRSPDAERKPRRVLWRDGGWIGSRMGSPPNGQDEDTNTVWYQAEDLEQRDGEQSDVKSQSVWYDRDTGDQKEQEQLEQREGEEKEGDLSSPQLFTKSSHQPSADLTQPHAAGTPPAPSHGPAAQRREVHASQREEEVGPDCKEEGSTHSRKNSETADNEETEGKGRKKRRKKRGKKGGTEAKLSSSSSVESQSHTETPTEPETNLNPEDKTQTGRADTQPTHREETDQAAMTLPSQTQGRTRDSHGPECNLTHSDPAFTPPEISLTDHSRTGPPTGTPSQTSETKEESADCHRPETLKAGSSDAAAKPLEGLTTLHPAGEEISDSTEPDFKDKDGQDAQTEREAEIKASSENEDWSVAGEEPVKRTGLLECTSPRSTEDSFVEEFPEEKTHRTQSVDSDNTGQPVDPEGRPAGFMECECPAEAGGLPCGGTTDMSPLLTGEGRADTAPREYLEHCLASEMLRDQPQKEEGKNELWVGEEEEGKERSCESGIEQREEESTSDGDKEQKYNEELAATAVAVVTVAVASAVASIELSQQLANNQSESEGSASKEELAQDASVPTKSLKQPAGDLLSLDQTSQLPAQLMSSEQSQVLAAVTAEAGDQLREQPHIKPAVNADISEKVKDEHAAAEPRNNQQHNIHTPTPVGAPSVTEDNQTQETPDRLLVCSRPLEEDSILLSDHKPLPEPGDKISAEEENQTEIKLQVESPPPSPVTDTGQHPEDTHMSCPDSEDSRVLRDQPVCQTEAVVQVESDRARSEHAQTGEVDDVSPVDAAAEQGGERCENVSSDVPDCREKESDQQLGDQLTALSEGGSPSVLCPLSQTPLDPPCDSAPDAAARQEEPTASVDLQQGEHQPSHSPADMKLLPLHGERKAEGGVSVEGEVTKEPAVDTVDGWKQRERTKMEREDEAGEKKTAVEDRNIQGADSCEQSRREQDSTLTLQIQRDRDVFCPVQPRPEPDTVTCTDVLPETDECVSLCLTHTDKDGLTVSPTLDDSVFKKPADPPPRLGPRDRGVHVSWSSTDDARPSEGDLSVGSSEPASPRSSRLSWKSETEDRGGGGEEEEKHDQLTENPVSSAIMRASIRSLSPLRRHSWEPAGNNATAQTDVTPSSPLGSPSAETKRAKTPLHRRSMSWCPSNLHRPDQQQIDSRSYSLEGLEETGTLQTQCPSILSDQQERSAGRREERGSLLSLTEEEQEGDAGSIHSQPSHQVLSVTNSCPTMFHHQSLTKSISMVAISQRDIGGGGPFSSNSGSLEYSISEEEPGPLRSDTEGKGGPKISRTFSYLRNKMTKKGKEKEKEKRGERERESKEKEKKTLNGHLFVSINPSSSWVCLICSRPLKDIKDTFICNNCGVYVHKCCRESLSVCSKSRTKMQSLVPDAAPGSAVSMRSKSTSSASSVSSTSSSSSRERWSTATTPDDQLPVLFPRRHPSIFNAHSNLSKSISTSNIAGLDDVPLKGLKFLSQSTDSLHQGSKVNASTESLTDEGTEMMDSQLMGEFECDVKDLEADSWSGTVDKKFLKALKKDEIKRQDVIYELYQTEFHHVRTLRIMSEVYYKGLQKELQLDTLTLDKIFPMLDELLDMHTLLFSQLLERKRASSSEGQNNNNFLIRSVGGVLLQQFSGCSAERMKKVYGKFCSRHNEAVNLYKDLHAKDKRFQAFIKRMMSSSIVRRLSIPECILLVTQRITKYPVLIQRILQHTKESDEDHSCVCDALRCVKELIAAVDSKVNEQEKKQKLREVYSRTDSKSIMRMKSGQMFAKEDLIRGRRLLHDGGLQLKNSAGRLKEVQAMLLSDVLVFLQEKDTKYVFASLDQRSTVISLQNLIVREVANEERGLFLITAGIERPEMVEVLASSKEERNTWRAIIQDAMHCMEKDEDEGVPSETEEDRRQQESRAKEIRELLRQKDEQIISLLVEKVHIFRDLSDCSPAPDDRTPPVRERMLFRATADDVTKGEPIVKDALREVESLHALVHSGVGGAGCSTPVGLTGGSVGPVCLPRRAETFGGFDSHQMNSSKNGEKEEGDESLDLRRTESDSVLKKGATASLQMLLKRNNEVQHTVTHLHDLLLSLQAVVVQQDSFIEDQRQALSDRLTANSSRHSSSSSLSSSSSSRPSSLIEQEKHRSLERQRQEAASLQKQQAAHQEEKRRREKAWDLKERGLAEREERLRVDEGETSRRRQELGEERETLQRKKEDYQRELERLREAQRRLDRDKEALRRDTERLEAMRREESEQLKKYQRTPSTTSEESIRFHSSGSLEMDSKEAEESKEVELSSSAPTKEPFLRIGSKRMGKNFNPFSSSSSSSSKAQGAEKESQLPSRLLQLTKPKDKKDKKKKKGKDTENKVTSEPQNDGDIFFC
ncbi:A-kinase anchor protein 13 [Notolabrus celidotus]|uniref:A-kinase anchor protein 13 n=1 Tax=Notolabrus celidotus TaxID=1203425 RepID=UPI00148F8D1B|nr:A-kinase anchor protein 13 [Notolabrus celidotus]